MGIGRSRKLRVAGCGCLIVAVLGLVTMSLGPAGARTAPTAKWTSFRTRNACGDVVGRRARCSAVEVVNVDAQVLNVNTHVTKVKRKVVKRKPAKVTTTTRRRVTTTTKRTTTTIKATTTTAKPTTTTSTSTTPPDGSSATCTTAHAGYTPCDLRSAYALAATAGGGTVAIVDAYDDPTAESDLAVYRAAYGLPACTTANGCFRKVNQAGGTTYPSGNTGWAQEISLDIDMVSAVCPTCHILLVEATTNSLTDLLAAENTAAALGADAISNSWGANEFASEANYDAYFHHNIPITASTGDAGYGVSWPASSPYVTAVGGTSLTHAANGRGWSETAWSGAGSGCSAYEPKPAFQTDSGCARRAVADVSAIADPNTGVAVYDSFNSSGWMVFGGTSVSAPIVAAVYALAGNGASITSPGFSYANSSSLFDVVGGTNGACAGSYLCTALAGYDGPTGLGTPNGTAAF